MPRTRFTYMRLLLRLRRAVSSDYLVLAILGLVVGTMAGAATVLFLETIDLIQMVFFGSAANRLSAYARALPWWQLLLAPATGGLLVGVAERLAGRLPGPQWMRPALGGLGIGAIAFPQVLGVGYGTTEAAMIVAFPLWLFICRGIAKIVATSIGIGFGFSGGVFSPSLVLGALVGGAYGIIATWVFPGYSSGPGSYTLVGMGAVAAAVLGAPISTTLIIFEMTGDYTLTLAVMVAVVVASGITSIVYGRSFFSEQLKRRGIDLKGEFESEALRAYRVRQVMERVNDTLTLDTGIRDIRRRLQESRTGELFVVHGSGQLYGTIMLSDLSETAFDHEVDDLITASDVARLHPPVLAAADLEAALALMQSTGEEHIAVVDNTGAMRVLGCVHQRDVMGAYNRGLLDRRHEEHGEG